MRNIVDFTEIEAYVARIWQGQRCILKPFFFNADFAGFAASGLETQTIKINSNADFLIVENRVAGANATQSYANCSLQITDGATLEQFFSAPVPLPDVCTVQGKYKQSMAVPRRVAGNSLLTIAASENTGASAVAAFQLSLVGVLVFTL